VLRALFLRHAHGKSENFPNEENSWIWPRALPHFRSCRGLHERRPIRHGPVRIMVGFAAAGTADILARVMGQWLSERLGQQFVIDRAISCYDQAIQLDPQYALAYNNRGEAYEAENDPDHAIADFGQALKLNPLAKAHQGLERVRRLLAKRSDSDT
jgi:tetratricopeptide (TPR) repeat protein